jgi:hypothetical protein
MCICCLTLFGYMANVHIESRSAIQVGQYAAWSYSTTKRKKK